MTTAFSLQPLPSTPPSGSAREQCCLENASHTAHRSCDRPLNSVQASHAAAAHAFLEKRAADTVTVHLDQCRGQPQHYGSGMLYGAQGTNSPPQSYLLRRRHGRSNTDSCASDHRHLGRWCTVSYLGLGLLQGSLRRALHDRRGRLEAHASASMAPFVIKTSDLWGADATQGPNFPFPGDGGNWASYDAFVQQIISDIKKHGMDVSLMTQIELWNEPDLGKVFWARSQDQYLEMYARGSRAFRKAFGPKSDHHLPLVGPSSASPQPKQRLVQEMAVVRPVRTKTCSPTSTTGTSRAVEPMTRCPSSQAMRDLIRQYGPRHWGLDSRPTSTERASSSGPATRPGTTPDTRRSSSTEGHALDSYGIASPAKRTASALVGNTGFTGTANVVFKGISALGKGASHLQAEVQVIPYNPRRCGSCPRSSRCSARQRRAGHGKRPDQLDQRR
ncbi:hypothetical protein L1887_54903 [Cichorium endivia]|nr:hypothetical protein L1887_54903 [Cichorium endivia]